MSGKLSNKVLISQLLKSMKEVWKRITATDSVQHLEKKITIYNFFSILTFFSELFTLVIQSHFCFLHLYSENKVMKPYFLFSYFLFFSPSSSEWLSKKLNELISLKLETLIVFSCLPCSHLGLSLPILR